jgi:hypothetical protein
MSEIVAAEMVVLCTGGGALPGWAGLVGGDGLDVGELNTHFNNLIKPNEIYEVLPGN